MLALDYDLPDVACQAAREIDEARLGRQKSGTAILDVAARLRASFPEGATSAWEVSCLDVVLLNGVIERLEPATRLVTVADLVRRAREWAAGLESLAAGQAYDQKALTFCLELSKTAGATRQGAVHRCRS